jgi:hypothetical protein
MAFNDALGLCCPPGDGLPAPLEAFAARFFARTGA